MIRYLLIVVFFVVNMDSFGQESLSFNERNYISVKNEFSHFSKDLKPWNTSSVETNFVKNSWSFQTKVTVSNRFSKSGWLLDQEVYKKFKSKDYLYLTAGVSSSSMFHNFHISGEYFNTFKSTWEHSYGLKFTQFSDSLFSIIGTTSISKYNGRFLTIIRANAGYQNSSVINTLNVNIKQRYYNSDDSSSDLTIGYGYNSNLILFENNDNIQLTENRTFVVGLNTFQKLSKRWYLNSNYSFQWFDFGNVERNQYSYSLSFYYTW